ncbi:MAG TPA: zinc-binding dehydrogenase [Micromonosporaceae bacterium]|nr:zinc-binding dehydrogenase [Micromonosporaceae bacterium]
MNLADFGYFALGNTLLIFVGLSLGALIRNTAGAVVAYMIYAFVAPGLFALLAYSQTWFRDTRARLIELTRTKQLTPIVDSTFPLGATANAIRHMEIEHTTGKVIITMRP